MHDLFVLLYLLLTHNSIAADSFFFFQISNDELVLNTVKYMYCARHSMEEKYKVDFFIKETKFQCGD